MAKLVHEHHLQGIPLPLATMLRKIDHGSEKACYERGGSLWMNFDSNSTAEA